MDENMMNERMWAFIRANAGDETGYPWALYMAEQSDSVPVPLYSDLYKSVWSALKEADENFDLPEEACVPDPEEASGRVFTTDVNAVKGRYVVVFAAKQLKKTGICNPNVLPESPKCKKKSWAVLLEDVYRQKKHYEFAVAETCYASLAGKGFICIFRTHAEAKQLDDHWRTTMQGVCYAEYLNKLCTLAETEEEKIYVYGLAAKAKLLRHVDPDWLVKELNPEKN